jgi:hypothetical protein
VGGYYHKKTQTKAKEYGIIVSSIYITKVTNASQIAKILFTEYMKGER